MDQEWFEALRPQDFDDYEEEMTKRELLKLLELKLNKDSEADE